MSLNLSLKCIAAMISETGEHGYVQESRRVMDYRSCIMEVLADMLMGASNLLRIRCFSVTKQHRNKDKSKQEKIQIL